MPTSKLLLPMVPLLLAGLALPLPTASALAAACAVGPGDDSCTFLCTSGFVTVFAFGASGGAVISGTCGVGGAACFAPAGGACQARAASIGLIGVCVLDDLDDPPIPDAWGSCSG